jgi:cell division transport system permease protein
MIARLKLLFSEAWRSTTSNLSTTLAATLTVLAAMFVLGCAIGLITFLNASANQVKKEFIVNVYYCSDVSCPKHGFVTTKEINNARATFESDPRVKSVQFLTRTEVLQRALKVYPQYRDTIPSNPFGPQEVISAVKGDYIPAIGRKIQNANLPGVQKVDWGQGTTKTILHYTNLIWVLSAIALVILGVVSMLLVINTIRLSIFARRREIEVMKLVGASNWFVRGPFTIEGLLTGLFGAVGAIVLLFLGREFILPSIHFLRQPGAHALSFELNALMLVAFGLLIGVVGSVITVQRFLRV